MLREKKYYHKTFLHIQLYKKSSYSFEIVFDKYSTEHTENISGHF